MPESSSEQSGRYDLAFWLGFSFLLCHELDAITQHEWRLLPILSGLSDEAAYPWFVLLHAPFFGLLLWATGHRSPVLRRRSQLGIDALLVVHAILHFAMRDHHLAPFDSLTSALCIYGAGLSGLTHAALVLASARKAAPPQG